MPRVPLALQSYQHPTLPLSAQRALNVYAEAQPQDAKARTALLLTPGLTPFSECGAGPIRGMAFFRDALIVASGGQVWRVAKDGSVEVLGGAPGSGFVRMATDGRWLALTDTESAETRLLNVSTVESITDPDFPGAKDVAVAGGFFVFLRPESETARGQWFISELRDPEAYNALDFASAEARPDAAVSLAVLGLDVWIFGERTTEIWVNTGRNQFPFERAPGGVIERGCAATASVQTMAGVAYWLGDDRVVYRASNSTPQRISTHALEQEWARLGSVADAEGWTYQRGGHSFYGLTIGGRTWVFDAGTALWHERASRSLTRWRGRMVLPAWEGLYVGDAVTGRVWRLDETARTDGGEVIEREAVTPPLHGEGRRMFMSRVTLEVDSGQGLTRDQGSDPQAMLDWSDDGGRTWSNELWRSMGKRGEWRQRVEWRRLGQFRERSLRVRMTDAVGTAFIAADFDAMGGTV